VGPPREDDLADRLGDFLAARLERDTVEVRGLRRLSGGASRETFELDLFDALDGGREPLILQRVRAGPLSASFSMESEARLLAAAAAGGVHVAPVVAASDDPGVLGAPFLVMGRIEGETIARRILRDDDFASARRVLVAQCARAMAAVHRIPTDVAPHLRAADPVGQLRSLMDALGEPHPAFELGMRWLDEHRPPAVEPAVVHGDFRLGNLMVGPDGLAAVLDWELAHLGDPMEDLGWLCVRAWRFGSPSPVAGIGEYDELFEAYAAATGVGVDPEVVRWWEGLGTLRWGVICILQASSHLSGASRSVELAAIGRRVCENEYDLLCLIGGRPEAGPTDPSDHAHRPSLHDAPSAAQLVEAVREFLEGDVMSATDGRVQFHARVAGRVLGMVERELGADAQAAVAAHAIRLAQLDVADDVELAAAIRAGRFDDRLDEARGAVWSDVLAKVRVANPGHLLPEDRPGGG
jgi:aminoglycoside phosphotransferase (APT) family kinase protein